MFRHVSYWDSCTREKITLCSLSVTRSVETTQASIKKEQVIIMTKSFDGILHSSEKNEEVIWKGVLGLLLNKEDKMKQSAYTCLYLYTKCTYSYKYK